MIIYGTPDEINKVLEDLALDFPRQNLESIGSGECFYWINGVKVYIRIKQTPD